MDELISILVPVYNVEKYLEQCIDSILHQTYRKLEVILIDDGSTDRSGKICDQYAKQDDRIRVIHKDNGGQDSARKAGMGIAKGKYIGYVDSDDWIEPDMYEKLYSYMIKYSVDVVDSGLYDWDGINDKKRTSDLEEGCYKNKVFDEKIGPYILFSGRFFSFGVLSNLCTKLFLKEVVEKYQMYEDLSENLTDDVMCSIPSIAEARSLYISHKCFYHYRIREKSTKRTVKLDIADVVKRCIPNWKERFKSISKEYNIDIQIKYFIMYLLCMKSIWSFDENLDTILKPYGSLNRNSKYVIYGAGVTGVNIEYYLKKIVQANVVFWADRNYKNLQGDLPVGNPNKIKEFEFDYIIISILWKNTVENAKNYLIDMGIPKRKILWIDEKYILEPELLIKDVIS